MKLTEMESTSYNYIELVKHTINQLIQACELISEWNVKTTTVDDYVCSPDGMQRMAASCMMIESIGEGIKKIDKYMPEFLVTHRPDIPWKEIKGLRDHIAHGYFKLDADIILDVVLNEIPKLKVAFQSLITHL